MGFLKNIFKREEILDPYDLSLLGVDIHSHLIPGIDDGASSMEESIELISILKEKGYKKLITTPHIMSDYFRNSPEIILKGLEDVRKELARQKIDILIEAAAEYNLENEFEELIEEDNILSFGGDKKYVLFELSFYNEPSRLKDVIWNLKTKGYQPVLAHVERYPYWHKKWDKIEDMVNRDVKLQLNIGSLTGAYGPEVKNSAIKLIDEGLIDLVGSDCHNLRHIDMINYAITSPYFHKLCNQDNLINREL
jgi:tyrosine-protein phosphatase YwqE